MWKLPLERCNKSLSAFAACFIDQLLKVLLSISYNTLLYIIFFYAYCHIINIYYFYSFHSVNGLTNSVRLLRGS